MSNFKTITATLLVASMATGCGVISQVNNARSGYQAYQSYQTAKGMMGAEPAFINASAFTITTNLMPRDEGTATEVSEAFTQLVTQSAQSVVRELDLSLSYCETDCPTDTVRIQFNEKGRDGVIEKFAMGDVIGGDLYLTKNGEVIEEHSLDMAKDYAGMAQTLVTAINVRLMKTVQVELKEAYEAGDISEDEMRKESEALVELMNEEMRLDGPLFELLQNKA